MGLLHELLADTANKKVVMKNIGIENMKSKIEVVRAYSLDAVVFFTQHQARYEMKLATSNYSQSAAQD